MDTIQFTIKVFRDRGYDPRYDEDFVNCHPEIHIYINGNNLIDLVQQVERPVLDPMDLRKPSERSYAGVNPEWRYDLRDEFLGKTDHPYSVVLTCTCFQDLCNSVLVKIEMDNERVTWKDFTSVLHGEESRSWGATPIDYSRLGPFVFDREQYTQALDRLGLPD